MKVKDRNTINTRRNIDFTYDILTFIVAFRIFCMYINMKTLICLRNATLKLN